MLNDLKSLPDDPVELQGMMTLLATEVKSQALMIKKLQHQLHGANRRRFGSKSEALNQLQLSLENEAIAVAAEESNTPEPEVTGPKNKPRRKPLPEHQEMKEWYGSDFDPNAPETEELKAEILSLAKKWNPRKPK